MERKEKKGTDMVRITIVAERVYGEPDADESIEIPKQGEIKREVDKIPEGDVIKTIFRERHCRRYLPSPRSFQSVKKGDLYMLWVEERGEWVGIKYEHRGWEYQGAGMGTDEWIYASGPFKLNDECAGLILRAYNNPLVPIEKVLHTSPTDFGHNSA